MSVYADLLNKFQNNNVYDQLQAQFGAGQGAGTKTTYPSLSTWTDADGVTHQNTGAPSDPAAAAGGNAGAGANTPVAGQGFDEEYWKKVLGGGTGVDMSLGGGGNVFGTGPGANADLEAILMREGLPQLDAQTLAAFAKAREAQMLQAQGVFTTEKDALLEDLFGRGMQRSTVAGESGGRMLEGQARTLAGIEANDAMARLGQQNTLADRVQKGAMAASDTRARVRAAQASENAAASGANATRAMASANLKAAEIGARSRMATTMAELDLKRELGLGDLDLRADQLDFSYWAKEGDWANQMDLVQENKPEWWQTVLGVGGALGSAAIGAWG